MKAITIKQPWASLIVEGIKDVENRTWACPKKYIGQQLLIHAGGTRENFNIRNDIFTKDQLLGIPPQLILQIENRSDTLGAIIGSVQIVDCVINHPSVWAEQTSRMSPENIYNWVLANPIKFPKPIPCKGKLRFWEHEMICPEFPHFGASYPDARCIEGYLYDLDSLEGDFLTVGGDDPCPYCNPSDYIAFNQ